MDAPTTQERLQSLYDHPGPYVTVFVTEGEASSDTHAATRFAAMGRDAAALGAPDLAMKAIDARLALPVFGDVGARAVVAAADGATVVETAHEGPADDIMFVDALPYAAPLLEWEQWRVPHMAVVADSDVYEAVIFHPDAEPEIKPIGVATDDAASTIGQECRGSGLELVTVSGDPERVRSLVPRLAGTVPMYTEVVTLEDDAIDDLSRAVVRAVADKVARRTVALLQEFRFLSSHDGAVDGPERTVEVLQRGTADMVLIHDDPDDDRRAWFGPRPQDISLEPAVGCPHEARLVDAVIRSAVLQGTGVRIVPSTGERGPDGNIGALLRDPTVTAPAVVTDEEVDVATV